MRGLALELVAADERRLVWNELVAAEHPRGAVCHAGAQLRYLIVSDHGILGALGFAAAALQLADRDRWIGCDDFQRRRLLHRVAALGRFPVRPAAQCRNLASKALALRLRRLPDDFRHRYGYEPLLLETFVDRSCHDGACFVAANWIAAASPRPAPPCRPRPSSCSPCGRTGARNAACPRRACPPSTPPRASTATPGPRRSSAAQLDGVRPVCVMDREGDVFELFAERADLGTVDLLVRAKHNRLLARDEPKLFDAARHAAAGGEQGARGADGASRGALAGGDAARAGARPLPRASAAGPGAGARARVRRARGRRGAGVAPSMSGRPTNLASWASRARPPRAVTRSSVKPNETLRPISRGMLEYS